MVARIYQPGAKVDYMPVFEGAQGINKSFALDAIGGQWFAESHEDITSKDFRQTLRGKMLVEFSELHAFKRAEIERIKGMITCRVDRYRESYGRHAKDYPRRCVFAGTTNRDDWVNDDTGARRFWPIRCTAISLDYLRGNREQLFAEAVSLFKAGAQWWDINQDLASQEQNERRDDDVWTSPVLNYAERKEFVIVREILSDVLGIEAKGQTSAEAIRVSRILRIAGYSKYQKWYLGRNEKVWKKPFKLDQIEQASDI
jgi:putative DNA primase/helicase